MLPAAKGLLDTATSYVGSVAGTPGTAYTEAVTGYDAAGRPLGTSITLPAGTLGTGSAAYTYTTTGTYNPDGSLATQTEPAAGGLSKEVLSYTYTSLGRLYSLIGAKQYLTETGYDPASSLVVGQARDNGTNSLDDAYTYTNGTLRLSEAKTTTSASTNNLVADLHYSYDNAGNITETRNTPSGAPADNQCYQYDYLQQLTQAWTPASDDCGSNPSSTGLGGPAPYWNSYSYYADGNRSAEIEHAVGAGGSDTGDQYWYPAATSAHPHAVAVVDHYTAPEGTTNWTFTHADNYTYDANGQTNTDAGQTLGWDPQGQLTSIKEPDGTTQTRVYDADGNLLVQTDPVNGTTAYLGDTDLQVAPGSSTVTGQRIYTANNTPVAVRTKAGISWLDTDPQGTSELTENFATGAVTTRFFDPFGNPRGNAPDWPENNRGFLNKPTDPLSGLTTLGAREYAPQIGRFISVDPRLDLSDPQSVNGYAYADNDPVTNSDPTGQFCVLADGQCIKVGQTHTHPEYGVGNQGGSISRPINETQAAQWNGGYDPVPYHATNHHHHDYSRAVLAGAAAPVVIRIRGRRLPNRGTIDPKRVRFSQDSVMLQFRKDPRTINDLASALEDDPGYAANVRPIRIFQRNGSIFTLDNRRLVAFQKAGVHVPYRVATQDEIAAFNVNPRNSIGRIHRGGRAVRIRDTDQIWDVFDQSIQEGGARVGSELNDDGGGAISRAVEGCGECKDKPF